MSLQYWYSKLFVELRQAVLQQSAFLSISTSQNISRCDIRTQKRCFSNSNVLLYRRKPRQVTRQSMLHTANENSRKVDKHRMRILQTREIRRSRDSKKIRQWRTNLFRAHTLPLIGVKKDGNQEEESEMMKLLKKHERKMQEQHQRETYLRRMNNMDVLPSDVEIVQPLMCKAHEIYPTIKLKRASIPPKDFIDKIQNPFRKEKLDDEILLQQLKYLIEIRLSSQLISFFSAYEQYFNIKHDSMNWIIKHCKKRADVWWCLNYIRKKEGMKYLDQIHAPTLLSRENARLLMRKIFKLGGVNDLYTSFALLYESPLVNNYDFMKYADDYEYSLFANDKKWKLVPTSTDYMILVEQALMHSIQPSYDVEQIIMTMMNDPQMTLDNLEDETKIIEYWIQGYVMSNHLDQALDIFRYYVTSPITYEERQGYTTIMSSEKMEEPIRECIIASHDERTYLWFCKNVCPHALEGLNEVFSESELEEINPKKKLRRRIVRKRKIRRRLKANSESTETI